MRIIQGWDSLSYQLAVFAVTVSIHANTLHVLVFGLIKDNDVVDMNMAGDQNWNHCRTSTAVMYIITTNKIWV